MNTLVVSRETILIAQQCPVCGIHYAIPEDFSNLKYEKNGNWYCPNGHSLVFTESAKDRLEKDLKAAREDAAYFREEAERTQRSLSATKGVLTRTKKRIANGVCPCCHRQFVNLHRHMTGQHPEYAESGKGGE